MTPNHPQGSRTEAPVEASPNQGSPPPPQERVPSATRRHRWIWVVVLLVFALLFVSILRRPEATPIAAPGRTATGPAPVVVATAKLSSLGVYLDAIGTVTPVYTDSITAQVTGVIRTVYYREGQFVQKGDPLIDVDSRPYEAQLEQAEGTLERDQSLLAEAQMDLERYQKAWARNGVSRQTLEDQEKLVEQDKGTVKTDQGLVRYDQVQVIYCHITSPISGRAGLRLVDPGNLVTANATTPLVVITQLQPITVVFPLAEDSLDQVLSQMRQGRKLPAQAWDRQMKAQLAAGQLVTIDNQIDTTTGTVKLRASFDNRNLALFPNQFVNTRLLVDTLQNQIVVPSSAVQHNGDVAFVYLIQNGQAKLVNVKTGVSDGEVIAVEGIHPGDVVANSSFEKLQDGARVTISHTPLPSGSPESSAP